MKNQAHFEAKEREFNDILKKIQTVKRAKQRNYNNQNADEQLNNSLAIRDMDSSAINSVAQIEDRVNNLQQEIDREKRVKIMNKNKQPPKSRGVFNRTRDETSLHHLVKMSLNSKADKF